MFSFMPNFTSEVLLLDLRHEELEKLQLPMMVITPELVEQFFFYVREFNQTFNSISVHLDYFQQFVETKINVIYTEKHNEV
jgi:hypothetical protein